MLERGPKELEFEQDMFGEIFNRYGCHLIEYVTCPCCRSEVEINCGQPEQWFVIHVEQKQKETGYEPFWVLWRDLYFLPEVPLPFPNDIGVNSVHLMRFLYWDFKDGVILHEQHGRRFFIEYPSTGGESEWEEFRALAQRSQEYYAEITRQMIKYSLQVVSSVVGAR